jgi:hypothetical protein
LDIGQHFYKEKTTAPAQECRRSFSGDWRAPSEPAAPLCNHAQGNNNMTRNTASSLAYVTTVAAAAMAAALVSTSAYAESPTIDNTPFVSSKTRAEVQAELKTPFMGGDPWSSRYNMFGRSSTLTTEQVRGAYKMSRDEVHALTAEDSGSAALVKGPMKVKTTATMGGPAADLATPVLATPVLATPEPATPEWPNP